MIESKPFNGNRGLRALDPNLPFLASEAAIDIDNILSERAKDLTAIRRLADQLNHSIKLDDKNGSPRSLMDPATLTVLGVAVVETAKDDCLKKIEDLLGEAGKIAKALLSDSPTSTELEQARNFCLALSRAAVAYRQSIRDPYPSHPFRR